MRSATLRSALVTAREQNDCGPRPPSMALVSAKNLGNIAVRAAPICVRSRTDAPVKGDVLSQPLWGHVIHSRTRTLEWGTLKPDSGPPPRIASTGFFLWGDAR